MFGKISEAIRTAGASEVDDPNEPIVQVLKAEKGVQSSEYFTLLKDAGFKSATTIGYGFPRITQQAILDYLVYKLKRKFNSTNENGWYHDETVTKFRFYRLYVKDKQDNRVCWDEQKVEDYEGTPPTHVLQSAKKAREAGINDLRVVEIRDTNDPLLIARVSPSLVFLIDWWDKDFTAEDILALTNK